MGPTTDAATERKNSEKKNSPHVGEKKNLASFRQVFKSEHEWPGRQF